MSLRSSVRFFYRGPGIALVIVAVIIGVGWVLKQGNDKRQAEAEKRQKSRELGHVSPTDTVDASQASKETVLANGHLIPGYRTTQPEINAPPLSSTPVQQRQQALPTLVSFYAQVAATPTPTPTPEPERPKVQEIFLPPSIFIPCVLVNTIESSHINTPVVGEVIRPVYEQGHLIIPAGTIVSCFAQSGAVRDRIEVAGAWLLVFPDGKQLKVNGIACVRQADATNQQFGPEDGSAGLAGQLVESDHWANAKAFLALLMTTTGQIATSAANGVVSRGFGGGVALPDTSAIQAKYLDQLLNGETGDGRFVRVPASTEFYIFPTETVLPTHRSVENSAKDSSERAEPPTPSDPIQAAVQVERDLLKQNQQPNSQDANKPSFKY
jgi:Bacterial conjugation TrbI-like protein